MTVKQGKAHSPKPARPKDESSDGRKALLFPARPSPMTPEEAKAFRREMRKRTDKILAALAE